MPRLWDISSTVSALLRSDLGLEVEVSSLPTARLENLSGLAVWVKPARVVYGDLGQRARREYEVIVQAACPQDDAENAHAAVDLVEGVADHFVHKKLEEGGNKPICHEAVVEAVDDEALRKLRLYSLSVRLRFVVTV